MSINLSRELDQLKNLIMEQAALAEAGIGKALEAVSTRNPELARQVVAGDRQVDLMENRLEEECLKILALHQPVASDLRYVVACLKMNNDLERIGDQAVKIAKRSEVIINLPRELVPKQLDEMADKSRAMLKLSLDALIGRDADLARKVIAGDDEVDELKRLIQRQIVKLIGENPRQAKNLIALMSVSRGLERVADYATNLAEDVIYLVEGSLVRHQQEQGKPSAEPR